jgi:thioredoxin reductase
MSVETPARIAVLGAGPIGLEAALYARYLGYDVDVYERGRVAEHLYQWGHVRLFTPFRANCSSMGLAALANQDESFKPPQPDELLSARELADRYYVPLSQSDLLTDFIHPRTEVLAIGRGDLLKGDMAGEDRSFAEFRILVSDAHSTDPAGRRIVTADVVIDATGTFAGHNWLGEGGIPAVGEMLAERHIDYGMPDILGTRRNDFAHKHALVVGDGHAAARSIIALAQLGHDAPYTQVTWVVRRPSDSSGPVRRIPNDPWQARDQLAEAANRLVRSELGHLAFYPETVVRRVLWHEGLEKFQITLAGEHTSEIEVDRVIANVGHRPDNQIFAELQVGEDPIRGAATRWSTEDEHLPDRQLLATAEPDFYVLGAKSVGRDSRFTIAAGLEQIRELFTILGDRPDLDLYGAVR